MTDLDRLLEQVEAAKETYLRSAWVSIDTIIGLIERVKKAEAADWDSHYEAHTKAQVQLTALEAERDALIERVKEAEQRAAIYEEEAQRDYIEQLEARLRAAEKVVEAARRFRHPMPYDACPICVALSHYDEAVGRVKE